MINFPHLFFVGDIFWYFNLDQKANHNKLDNIFKYNIKNAVLLLLKRHNEFFNITENNLICWVIHAELWYFPLAWLLSKMSDKFLFKFFQSLEFILCNLFSFFFLLDHFSNQICLQKIGHCVWDSNLFEHLTFFK